MNRFTPRGPLSRRDALGVLAAGLAGACAAPEGQSVRAPNPLWPVDGTPVLRGAVIAQRRRREAVDGPAGGFGGAEQALPAYGAREFDALADAGANLVVMSFPELWTIAPPYRRDAAMADLLGRQLDAARAAGLYVVLGLRSGPGRSDFIFHRDSAGAWFPEDLIVESIWTDREAQAAWGAMCVDAASLISERAETAGLLIMVEPDPNVSGVDLDGGRLGAWAPSEYARKVSDVSDWRRIAGDCARRVRASAADLPILLSPPAFARTDFLPVMGEPPVEGCVWCVHDYEPREFTHTPRASRGILPFNAQRDDFAARIEAAKGQGAPVFLGEFGAARWATGVDAYYRARIADCEARGINWAAFRWPTFDQRYEERDDTFNLNWGGEAGRFEADGAEAIGVLKPVWGLNERRPSRTAAGSTRRPG